MTRDEADKRRQRAHRLVQAAMAEVKEAERLLADLVDPVACKAEGLVYAASLALRDAEDLLS